VVKIIELLSPARDMASLNAAIKNGTDSVYIGIEGYNMRSNVANFSTNNLIKAVQTCHKASVKLYVCTNTIVKEGDLKELRELMPIIKSSGADAVIVSDLGALNIASENQIPIHMSVQANISNSEALKILEKLGVSRIILSRENTLKEIKEIAKNTNIEIEVFVHGSMCIAISGRCFISSHLYNRSANCGECLQPCRKEWKITSEDGEELIITGAYDPNQNPTNKTDNKTQTPKHKNIKSDKTHILSPKDLCMLEYIPQLVDAGVTIFKIEGRAKPADYVATVTRIYREAINIYNNGMWDIKKQENIEKWKKDLTKVFNRGFDTGFFYKIPEETSSSNQATCIKKDIGTVVNYYQKVEAAEIRLWENLELGEEIIIQGNKTGSISMKVKSMQINGTNIKKISKGQNVGLQVKEKVRPHDTVYKIINKDKNQR
jgi:U32 family peptidase